MLVLYLNIIWLYIYFYSDVYIFLQQLILCSAAAITEETDLGVGNAGGQVQGEEEEAEEVEGKEEEGK